ncbi:hypothetical protein K7I13_03885 [Brucepastera parasyntrophica]|uniref:SLC13 family permease n=1 Tax=Brucepastera parasyntrophica TaxID=2880008 RepID=UPI0021097504|nr:SLC13 family permease [Brucepastera parasyntrophica]ULQ60460.1 hypothetical protein K7I13_03885 [Brucepastera parasyntrophica]
MNLLLPGYLKNILAIIIILFSLVGIAIGRIPRFRMNRATIAFSGAAFLVAIGVLSFNDAAAAIDLGTLILILSMMIITANLKLSGFFELAGMSLFKTVRRPKVFLLYVMSASAVLSAFFLNDTICIMLTPLVTSLCLRAKRNPVPYLIGLALAANIGSAATIIGNPQNMLIGSSSGIPFLRFLSRMAVPSIAGVAAAYGIVLVCFRGISGPAYRRPQIRNNCRKPSGPLMRQPFPAAGKMLPLWYRYTSPFCIKVFSRWPL